MIVVLLGGSQSVVLLWLGGVGESGINCPKVAMP
jgi:hypothetical protein